MKVLYFNVNLLQANYLRCESGKHNYESFKNRARDKCTIIGINAISPCN